MKTPRTLGRRRWLRSPGRYGAANKGGTQQLLERLRRRKLVEGPTSRSALYKDMNAGNLENLTAAPPRFLRVPVPVREAVQTAHPMHDGSKARIVLPPRQQGLPLRRGADERPSDPNVRGRHQRAASVLPSARLMKDHALASSSSIALPCAWERSIPCSACILSA